MSACVHLAQPHREPIGAPVVRITRRHKTSEDVRLLKVAATEALLGMEPHEPFKEVVFIGVAAAEDENSHRHLPLRNAWVRVIREANKVVEHGLVGRERDEADVHLWCMWTHI